MGVSDNALEHLEFYGLSTPVYDNTAAVHTHYKSFSEKALEPLEPGKVPSVPTPSRRHPYFVYSSIFVYR